MATYYIYDDRTGIVVCATTREASRDEWLANYPRAGVYQDVDGIPIGIERSPKFCDGSSLRPATRPEVEAHLAQVEIDERRRAKAQAVKTLENEKSAIMAIARAICEEAGIDFNNVIARLRA